MAAGRGDDELVHNAPDRCRYELLLGGALAGFTSYRDDGPVRIFLHTEVDRRHGGHGLGSRLVRAALADARARGKAVAARCPFVAAVLEAERPDRSDGRPG